MGIRTVNGIAGTGGSQHAGTSQPSRPAWWPTRSAPSLPDGRRGNSPVTVMTLTGDHAGLVVRSLAPVLTVVAAFALVVIFLPSVEYRALGPGMRFWSGSYRPLAADRRGHAGPVARPVRGRDAVTRPAPRGYWQFAHTPVTANLWGLMAKPYLVRALRTRSWNMSSGTSVIDPHFSQARCPWAADARW